MSSRYTAGGVDRVHLLLQLQHCSHFHCQSGLASSRCSCLPGYALPASPPVPRPSWRTSLGHRPSSSAVINNIFQIFQHLSSSVAFVFGKFGCWLSCSCQPTTTSGPGWSSSWSVTCSLAVASCSPSSFIQRWVPRSAYRTGTSRGCSAQTYSSSGCSQDRTLLTIRQAACFAFGFYPSLGRALHVSSCWPSCPAFHHAHPGLMERGRALAMVSP